jgi:hypothetical protein
MTVNGSTKGSSCLLISLKAANKATSDTRHLPDQGAAPSREGCLAGQRFRGLGYDARVVVIAGSSEPS